MGKRYWTALNESFPEKQEIARESRGGWAKKKKKQTPKVIAFDYTQEAKEMQGLKT